MITIIYPYRNRDQNRVIKSLNSLKEQTNNNFKVLFIDYGSKDVISEEVKSLLELYDFVSYIKSYTEFQPWSRSKAINIGLKQVDTENVFIADIDMIFRYDFISYINTLDTLDCIYFFKVGYLNKEESLKHKEFDKYKVSHYSTEGAKGLSFFSIKSLLEINGFDEYLSFWGAEDEDIHYRLQKNGYKSIFCKDEVKMYHQWHPTYRGTESDKLTKELRIRNIVKINQVHYYWNKQNKIKVNDFFWGSIITKDQFDSLKSYSESFTLNNKKEEVDHFIYYQLNQFKGGVLSVRIQIDENFFSIKKKIKKILGKSIPEYYSLKEINDRLLMHILSFYSKYLYSFQVSDDLMSIEFKILK